MEIEMYKTVLKIAASPEPCHGEEETEQVQASPRQVECLTVTRTEKYCLKDGCHQETTQDYRGHAGSGGG